MRFLDENRRCSGRGSADESPDWVPDWVDDRVFDQGVRRRCRTSWPTSAPTREHELRKHVRRAAAGLRLTRLRTDPDRPPKVEELKTELLDHPAVRDLAVLAVGAGEDARRSTARRRPGLRAARAGRRLADPAAGAGCCATTRPSQAKVRRQALRACAARRRRTTPGPRRRDHAHRRALGHRGDHRRLELQVGRDLQFIRINGTVVGSLAGLLIYSLGRLL